MAGVFDRIKDKMSVAQKREKYVPEWDVTIRFKTTSVYEASIARAMVGDKASLSDYHVALVNLKALDENGCRIFDNKQLREMQEWPCGQLFTELAAEMNVGVTLDAAKNACGTTQSSDSGSSSQPG